MLALDSVNLEKETGRRLPRAFPFQWLLAKPGGASVSTCTLGQALLQAPVFATAAMGIPVDLRRSETHFNYRLHAIVVRAASTLRWYPSDDLVRVSNVAGLAMDAVGWVQADAFTVGLLGVIDHFIDVGGTEILAGATEFLDATRITDVGVMNDQVRRLIFFMLGAGVIEVGELVEGELAIAFRRAKQMRFRAAVGSQVRQFFKSFGPGTVGGTATQATSTGELLNPGVQHSPPEAMLESLVEVSNFPEFLFNPARVDLVLILAESRGG